MQEQMTVMEQEVIREVISHVHDKRQTSDSSWVFLRTDNKHKNCPEQFLWIKLAWKYSFSSRSNKQLTTIKGKTWSPGKNSRLAFGEDVTFNLSVISEGKHHVYVKRQTRICTTWLPFYFSFAVHYFYT